MADPNHRAGLATFLAGISLFMPLSVTAQIAGDGTLGTQVNGELTAPCTGFCLITDGAVQGRNLFHSLQQFSLPNPTDLAGFIITPATANVIVRVTGQGSGFVSNLNGTIGTITPTGALTPANFFLLNPNGVILGPNATLLVGGSFLATTAERMQFQDGTVFSTRDPAPLLTVSVPIGLQAGTAPGRILSEMPAIAGVTGLFTDIALVGGEVSLDGSLLVSPGRRVELGGLAAQGTVGLNATDGLSLRFPEQALRANISLRNGSVIDVSAAPGGTISIAGQNIEITGSLLLTGVNGLAGSAQAGDISLNAIDQLTLAGASSTIPNTAVINAVLPNSTGNGGKIHFTAGTITMNDGARVLANTTGTGNAGDILLQARDRVSLNGASTVESNVTQTGVGQGGTVQIEANAIVLNSSQIQALTAGQGNSGNVVLVAQGQVSLAGQTAAGIASSLITGVNPTGMGAGGTLQISASELTLTDEAQLRSASLGRGNAGDIVIDVRDRVQFDAGQALSVATGVGNAGAIRITATTLELLGFESALQSSTAGVGNASDIVLNIRDRVTLDASSVISAVDIGAVGRGGDLQISANIFELTNRGQLNAATFGRGNGGSILIEARDRVLLDSADVVSYVQNTGIGNGGTIQISTKTLTASNQTGLNTLTAGAGSAGGVVIRASDQLLLDDSFITSRALPGSTGGSNDIVLSTNRFELTNGATINANTETRFNAGAIRVDANSITLANRHPQTGQPSGLFSQTGGTGTGGSIVADANSIQLLHGALIDVRTVADGNGGSIFVNANTVDLRHGSLFNAATEKTGRAGNIQVNARSQMAIAGTLATGDRTPPTAPSNSGIFVRSIGTGGAGDITVTTPQLRLHQGVINAESATVDGGNINLKIRDLMVLRNGSLISATAGTAAAGGDGGNITIHAPRGFIIAVTQENSDITANAFFGNGGRVAIAAEGIYGLQFRPQLTPFSDITASSTFGLSGTVILNTPNVDPSRGLQALPTNLVDPTRQIVQTCPRGTGSRDIGSFTITGRDSLPPSPTDLRPGSLPLKPLASLDGTASPQAFIPLPPEPTSPQPQFPTSAPLIEAQALVRTANNEVFLVANAPTAAIAHFARPLDCDAPAPAAAPTDTRHPGAPPSSQFQPPPPTP